MKILKVIDEKLEEYFLVYSLMFSVALVFMQVVMRYVFKASLSWSEELARYIFLWQIWVGASYAVKRSSHLRVEIVKNLMSDRGKMIFETIAMLLWIGFALFLTTKSALLTGLLFKGNQLSPAMRIPMGYAYASVPVGCGFMTIRLFQKLYKDIKIFKSRGV